MTTNLEWPDEISDILVALEKFADIEELRGPQGQMVAKSLYGFRAEVRLTDPVLAALRDLHARAGDQHVRFKLPGERTAREGLLYEPVLLGSSDGYHRVRVVIGGGHPVA